MDELTLDGKTYISSKKAAKITGYARDYVGQLAREGYVEAKLVGRSWYVLESSIRSHRFGAGNTPEQTMPAASPEKEENGWLSATYEAEEVTMIPSIPSRQAAPAVQEAVVAEEVSLPVPIEDMQAIWRDWFTRKEAETQSTKEAEQVEQSHEPEDDSESGMDVPLQRDEGEVPVAVSRIRSQEVLATSTPSGVPVAVQRSYEAQIERDPVWPAARTEGGRHSTERSKGGSVRSYAILNAIFIAIAGLAVVIFLIGSGLTERFTGNLVKDGKLQSVPIRFLSGISLINKATK